MCLYHSDLDNLNQYMTELRTCSPAMAQSFSSEVDPSTTAGRCSSRSSTVGKLVVEFHTHYLIWHFGMLILLTWIFYLAKDCFAVNRFSYMMHLQVSVLESCECNLHFVR